MSLTTSDKRAMREAAAVMEDIAADIHQCNTVDGEWDPDARDLRIDHNRFVRLARRLREIAAAT